MRHQPAQLLVFKGHRPRPGNNLANVDVQVDTPYDRPAKVPANANGDAKFSIEHANQSLFMGLTRPLFAIGELPMSGELPIGTTLGDKNSISVDNCTPNHWNYICIIHFVVNTGDKRICARKVFF
jgi:hypothetical protein